jgi:hypothetical protein
MLWSECASRLFPRHSRRVIRLLPLLNPHIPIAASQVSHYPLLVIPTGGVNVASGPNHAMKTAPV